MKKKLLGGLATGLLVFGVAGMAQAALTTIGTATYGGSDYNLIWDDDNNGNSVVWLDYIHVPADWAAQNTWAAGLDSSLTYNIDTGYTVDWGGSSWRLPSAGVNPTFGYNQTTSEMGHLLYTELGLQSYSDRGLLSITTAELNASNFDNLFASFYWSGTEYANDPDFAWVFDLCYGDQSSDTKDIGYYGLAIRGAEVSAVPIPGAIWLLGSGLAALAGNGLRRKKKA